MRLTLPAFCCFVLLASVAWAAKWEGRLTADPGGAPWIAGATAEVSLQAVSGEGTKARVIPGALTNRTAAFELLPYRFTLPSGAGQPVSARRGTGDVFRLEVPVLQPGWYLLLCTVTDDDHQPVAVQKAVTERTHEAFLARAVVAVAAANSAPTYRVHTERARVVFSPGEEIRIFVSCRNAPAAEVLLALQSKAAGEKAIPLARLPLAGSATRGIDLSATQSMALAPGDYELVALAGQQVADRLPIRFVSPAPLSGGLRWAHTMPHGTSSGFDASPALPQKLDSPRYKGQIEGTLARIHNANHWVNFFANDYPVVGPDRDLPHAADPRLPPAEAYYRPSLTHAFYQELMAAGISLGICAGYGEDYKAEVYMPIPTVDEGQMATLARKYLISGLGAACLPHFTSLYTDYYGHMDYDGAGEIDADTLAAIRERTWTEATALAGMRNTEKPRRYAFERRDLPDSLQALLKDKEKGRAWDEFLKGKRAGFGDDSDWIEHNYKTPDALAGLWREAWTTAGVAPVPEAPRYIPLPTLDDATAIRVGPQAAYEYASYALRGIERAYGTLTRMVESELPAVFTIHNKSAMNHSTVSHAWSGTRTPNIDPAYLDGGATAISVSEWNLDGVPRPYFLPTFYNQFLLDRGHPVYQCGLWKQMGCPSRFMRDAIFWGGRQIQTYFDQAENMTWSHKGADQTTYAANERMASVTEFLSYYSDLFPQLQPVREVGLYVPPVGGPWGTGVTRGHYVATLAALMSDHQVHFVSHGDIPDDRLKQYPILFAPSLHNGDFVPFEAKGFRDYIARGGRIVGAMAPEHYHPEDVYKPLGIRKEEVPQLDPQTGETRRNKDGTPRLETVWHATPEQWAQACRTFVWGTFDQGVTVAPINVHRNFTHLDEQGREATWSGSHWTGHHTWAGYRGAALHQYKVLKAVLDGLSEPVVRKDQPEVFVNVCRPPAPGQGLFVFASNWTLPDQPDLYRYRIPQGFFNSAVKPLACTLAVKAEPVGAVYDLVASREVPFERRDGRVVFRADLDSVEGRVFALLPERVANVALELPAAATAGQSLQGRYRLLGESGQPIPVPATVRLTCTDKAGRTLLDVCRALPPDGTLPPIPVPVMTADSLTVKVVDPMTGRMAGARVRVDPTGIGSVRSAPDVTVFRGDRIHAWLKAHAGKIRIVTDASEIKVNGDNVEPGAPTAHAEREQEWARQVKNALQAAGIASEVIPNTRAVSGPLHAHPWKGSMGGYRNRHTVPNQHIPGPVLLVGSPRDNHYLSSIERAWVVGRELGGGNVTGPRAVLAWAPKALSPGDDTVILAADDAAGLANACAELAKLATAPRPDPFYEARESVRTHWAPREVVAYKNTRTTLPAQALPPAPLTNLAQTVVREGWHELATLTGTPIFDLDASANGIAVGTRSWIKPTGLLTPDGKILGFWGGGNEVTPRDVGVSADGRTAAAGYSLLGCAAAYGASGRTWRHTTPIVHKDNPFEWDSFKDSDRHLGVSPDHSLFVVPTSTNGILALDAANGGVRWALPHASPPGRPRGQPHPEVAFSRDATRVLLAPLTPLGERTVRFQVTKFAIDPATGRTDKKQARPETITVKTSVLQRELMLVDTSTGKPVWRRSTGCELADTTTGQPVWSSGRAPEYTESIAGRSYTWTGREDEVPADAATREPVFRAGLALPFWHLYSTVGPGGAWCIVSTREAHFALLDETGNLLRTWEPKHLPRELDPGDMIPPSFLSGGDPRRMVAYAPQARRAFVFELTVGTPAQRELARKLETANSTAMDLIEAEVRDTGRYGNFDKPEYLEAFAAKLDIPAELEKELLERMRAVVGERRAGRKRDARFFESIVARIRDRLYQDDQASLDAAVGLRPTATIDLGEMICDAAVDGRMQTFYAGCWDGTVRAYGMDGAERWRAPVIGGCQVALVEETGGGALYAGGSRGDIYRIAATDGTVAWRVNITEATNRL